MMSVHYDDEAMDCFERQLGFRSQTTDMNVCKKKKRERERERERETELEQENT